MGNHISLSSPLLKSFVHADVNVGASPTVILADNSASSRRVITLFQNPSATESIKVIFASTGTSGIIVQPLSNISLDNYNGIVRASTVSGNTVSVHIAYSVV
jgi:hypothetical protein